MSFKVELPEIINMEDGIAPFVHIFTKEGKELSYIKSLNTKTLIATCYKLEKDSRGLLRVSNDGSRKLVCFLIMYI